MLQHWRFADELASDKEVMEKFSVNPPNVYGFGRSPSPPGSSCQILPDSLPARRLSARKFDVSQYEGPNVTERPKHAFAARGVGIHLDRLKSKFAHWIQISLNCSASESVLPAART
jgi:hypothetical protein